MEEGLQYSKERHRGCDEIAFNSLLDRMEKIAHTQIRHEEKLQKIENDNMKLMNIADTLPAYGHAILEIKARLKEIEQIRLAVARR